MSSPLSLQDIVKRSNDLPTMPAAALAAMREADNPAGTARTVAEHVSHDQALSARVLRLSNSAYYGLTKQVTDLQEAVVVLGMRSVRNLAVVAASYPWMVKPLKGYMLEPIAMWKHSFGVAVGAQLVAKQYKVGDPDLAFTAGLLHNIGKVAMSVWLDNKVTAMLKLAMKDNLTFDEVERKLLGYDHTEVGAYLAEMWNLPDSLIRPIRFHHNPDALSPTDPIVDCVHVADVLSMMMGYGIGGDGLHYNLSQGACERLGLSETDIESLSADFVASYELHEKMIEEMQSA